MTLDLLKVGDLAKIVSIDKNSNLYQRLIDLGFSKNSKVECVLESPWRNPKAYLVRGAVIAIRNEDAKQIKIVKEAVVKADE